MKKFNPRTPGRRQMILADFSSLSKVEPLKKLLKKISSRSGRNSAGRITVRHQGGGHKKLYRLVDFKQSFLNVPAKVEHLEYDPYRSAFIARIVYKTGERSYILAAHNLKVGDDVMTGEKAPLKNGNRLPLNKIPVGYQIFNVELSPNKGGQIARSAGSFVEVAALEGKFTHLKMPSGEIRKVLSSGFATLGKASNPENNLVVSGKAGRSRWLGIRPTVRGSVMNPVDHPYGGGEGRTQRGTKRPKDIWGNVTGGRRTRNKRKKSNLFIIQRRNKKK